MAGRQYTEEYVYAFLRRWDDLRGQWVDHFPQNVLVEVIMPGGRPTLLCRTYDGPQSVCKQINNCVSLANGIM